MKLMIPGLFAMALMSGHALASDCIESASSNFFVCSTDWSSGNIYQYQLTADSRYNTNHIAVDGYLGNLAEPSESLVDGKNCLQSPKKTHYLCAENNGALYQYRKLGSGFDKHHLAWNGHLGAFLEPDADLVENGTCIASPNRSVYLCAEENQNLYAYQKTEKEGSKSASFHGGGGDSMRPIISPGVPRGGVGAWPAPAGRVIVGPETGGREGSSKKIGNPQRPKVELSEHEK